MRLIIEIPEENYKRGSVMADAIRNGTPIPDDATLGDVFEMLIDVDKDCIDVHGENGKVCFTISQEKWDSPYKADKE